MNPIKPLVTLGIAGALIACGDSSTSFSDSQPMTRAAIIAAVAPDYGSSDIEIFNMSNFTAGVGNVERTTQRGYFAENESDITVAAHGEDFYRIGRYQMDNITKLSLPAPKATVWQYQADKPSEGLQGNPYDLIFHEDTKAYLLRYGAATIWVVNPEATTEAEFYLSEIDLSAYNPTGATTPGVSAGVIVDGKLYVTLQRLDGDSRPTGTSYVAVIDVQTDTEIDTQPTVDGLKGIALQGGNPLDIRYVTGAGLFVQNTGGYASWDGKPRINNSSIEKIDTLNYTATLVLDDEQDNGMGGTEAPWGLINRLAIIDSNKAYFAGYDGWQNNTLYTFDPANPNRNDITAVSAAQNVDIQGITVGPNGNLWVSIGSATDPRVLVIDPASDAVLHTINTRLNPTKIVFAGSDL